METQTQQQSSVADAIKQARQELVSAFTIAEIQTADRTKVERIRSFLESHKQEEVNEVLAGASKEQKAAGQKLPPFVSDLMNMGYQETTARTQLTVIRKVAKAFYEHKMPVSGDKGYDALYTQALEVVDNAKESRAKAAFMLNDGVLFQRAADDLGIRRFNDKGERIPLTAEQTNAIYTRMDQIADADKATASAKEYDDKVRAEVDRIFGMFKLDGVVNQDGKPVPDSKRNMQYARDVADKINRRLEDAAKAAAHAAGGDVQQSPTDVQSGQRQAA